MENKNNKINSNELQSTMKDWIWNINQITQATQFVKKRIQLNKQVLFDSDLDDRSISDYVIKTLIVVWNQIQTMIARFCFIKKQWEQIKTSINSGEFNKQINTITERFNGVESFTSTGCGIWKLSYSDSTYENKSLSEKFRLIFPHISNIIWNKKRTYIMENIKFNHSEMVEIVNILKLIEKQVIGVLVHSKVVSKNAAVIYKSLYGDNIVGDNLLNDLDKEIIEWMSCNDNCYSTESELMYQSLFQFITNKYKGDERTRLLNLLYQHYFFNNIKNDEPLFRLSGELDSNNSNLLDGLYEPGTLGQESHTYCFLNSISDNYKILERLMEYEYWYLGNVCEIDDIDDDTDYLYQYGLEQNMFGDE